jgi:hypothetical protein
MHLVSKSLPCVINICRPFLILLAPLAMFLVPTDAWEASVSQNLSITITPANLAFYVATNGSDSNPGTLASPFATLQACQTAMRNSSTIKTCHIRAGTYTGSGVGYNTVTTSNGSWSTTEALYLTSADNGETYAEYPSDFPANGISSAIFDGGAAAWSSTGSSSCPAGGPDAAVERGIYISGGNNITINELQFRNFCWSGVAIHGGAQVDAGCNPESTNNANGNIIKNVIAHDLTDANSICAGSWRGGTGGIEITGGALNNTVSHSVVFNITGMGIRAGSIASGGISGTVFDHNVVYNANTNYDDTGSFYMQDCGPVDCSAQGNSTGLQFNYNYAMNLHGGCCGSNGAHGLYADNGAVNVQRTGNVAFGGDTIYNCYFSNNTGPLGNTNENGNICDVGGTVASGFQWNFNTAITYRHNILIANLPNCTSGYGVCTLQNGTSTSNSSIGNNVYWNYNAAGNSVLTNNAISHGDASPNAVQPSFSCPGGNVNSWGFAIAGGSGVLGGNVTFPAQPVGWATPGFWGPPGYVVPHVGTAPSYIGSGINGC